jgi:molecular chaperone DnaJ
LRTNDFGDLYLETNIIIPESLNKEQIQLLEKFRTLEDNKNLSIIKDFKNKIKNFWENY